MLHFLSLSHHFGTLFHYFGSILTFRHSLIRNLSNNSFGTQLRRKSRAELWRTNTGSCIGGYNLTDINAKVVGWTDGQAFLVFIKMGKQSVIV
jgi:hypothetical protein